METKTYEAMEDVAKEGLAVLKDVLHNRDTDDKSLMLARVAATGLSSFTRVYQANSSREATLVTIMDRAAEGNAEFRRLVMAALPASPVAKALKEGNGTK